MREADGRAGAPLGAGATPGTWPSGPLPPAFDALGETSLVGTWEDSLGTRQWSHREGPVESLTLAAPLEEMLPETL